MHFLGIDIGTSAVKAVLVDMAQAVVAEASRPLVTHRPATDRSEQDADDWWRATEAAVAAIRAQVPEAFAGIAGIGLSGQMHALVALDAADRPVAPAMLWNDGRATAECRELEGAVPGLAVIAGVGAMPGFTAPKLLWLRRHEPAAFARIAHVLPAKDYVRLKLTGARVTDMTDAAGMLLLDEAARDWSDAILAAAGLTRAMLPRLAEGNAPAGQLRAEIAAAWGLPPSVIVGAGAGDAAAGAVGIGAVEPGDGFLSLGTSAQIVRVADAYRPQPETTIHTFAHGVPGRWFAMAALLNGAGVLDWLAGVLGEPVDALLARAEARGEALSPVTFVPYLAGERTPHDDPAARGVFAGLDHATGRGDLARAVLDGVVLALMEGQAALGAAPDDTPMPIVGGGARSRFWVRLIASALLRPLVMVASGALGPAFGAARLARLAVIGEAVAEVCVPPETLETVAPDPALAEAYAARLPVFRALYAGVRRVR